MGGRGREGERERERWERYQRKISTAIHVFTHSVRPSAAPLTVTESRSQGPLPPHHLSTFNRPPPRLRLVPARSPRPGLPSQSLKPISCPIDPRSKTPSRTHNAETIDRTTGARLTVLIPLSVGPPRCVGRPATHDPHPLRTKWTRRVPHPVLIGHAATHDASARRRRSCSAER